VWLGCIVLSGYVGLATMLSAAVLLPLAWVDGADPVRLAFALATVVFIVFNHRDNVRRLLHGCENRFERARVLHRLFRRRQA